MRHLIIYIFVLAAAMTASCSHSTNGGVPAGDTTEVIPYDSLLRYGQGRDSAADDRSDSVGAQARAAPAVEDSRSFYQRGYDEGYDNGREDGTMDLGDGYSYCDGNPYRGAARREYERGYRHGYREGYREGFYEYSDGDEEEYDEY